MKKIILILMSIIMAVSVVADGQQGIHEPGTGIESPEIREERQGNGQELNVTPILIQVQEKIRARNLTELRQIIQTRREEMNKSLTGMRVGQQEIYMNQNRVRLAVHAMLAMENLTGGIGRNISAIAQEFNNSVRATIRAEERIQNRSRLVRFLAGGDEEAADEIEQEFNRNQLRIQELQRLRQECGKQSCLRERERFFMQALEDSSS